MTLQHMKLALCAVLPSYMHNSVPALSDLLFDVASGKVTSDELQRRITADPSLASLLKGLVGQQIETSNTAISFGTGNTQSEVTVTVGGDLAGRDVIKNNSFVLTLPNVHQDALGSYIAQAAYGGNASVTVHNTYYQAYRPAQPDRNRQAMLAKVKSIWVTGLQEHSLAYETRITLDLMERPDAVALPLNAQVQELNQVPRALPSSTPIIDVFAHCSGELLILGEPGAGKTALLLELARDLIARAEQDITHPIPVVFNLSSWSERRPLTTWLVDELNAKYDVPRKVGAAWVEADALLPLLDGLDEVKAEHRVACVGAINAYRQDHGLVPVVVCSRTVDYDALAVRLRLQGAIVVQPLTSQQVDAFFDRVGEPLMALRTAMMRDAALRKLAKTPLMLAVMTLAYQGLSVEQVQVVASPEQQRRHLFNAYAERMFTRRGSEAQYPRERVLHWLSCLAQRMQQRGQSVFLVEHLQPDWLVTQTAHWQYVLLDRLALGVIVGLLFSIIAAVAGRLLVGTGLVGGLCVGLVAGLLTGLGSGTTSVLASDRSFRNRVRASALTSALIFALVNGLLFGLVGALLLRLGSRPVISQALITISMIGVTAGGLVGTLAGLLNVRVGLHAREVVVVERLRWSWESVASSMRSGFYIMGIGSAVVSELVFIFYILWITLAGEGLAAFGKEVANAAASGAGEPLVVYDASTYIWNVLLTVPFIWVMFFIIGGIVGGILGGLVGGLGRGTVTANMTPNQGIKRSIRSAIIGGLSVGSIFGLTSGLVVAKFFGLQSGMYVAILFGLICGLLGSLAFGGYGCLSHFALRFILWRKDTVPLSYVSFLDYCAERIFLRKVGGGYIFIHRMLLEYFASLEPFPENLLGIKQQRSDAVDGLSD